MQQLISVNYKGKIQYNYLNEEYEINFGTVFMILDFEQFKALENIVNLIDVQTVNDSPDKKIKVPFESDNISLLLSAEDIIDLKDLLGLQMPEILQTKAEAIVNMN